MCVLLYCDNFIKIISFISKFCQQQNLEINQSCFLLNLTNLQHNQTNYKPDIIKKCTGTTNALRALLERRDHFWGRSLMRLAGGVCPVHQDQER